MSGMRTCRVAGMVLGGLLWSFQANAADAPQLEVQTMRGQVSGAIADGTRVAQGRITSYDPHIGFQVWVVGNAVAGDANRYVLTGQQKPQNVLKVRLEKVGWQVDDKENKGIVLHTGDVSADFEVVADGNQVVATDTYPIQIKGFVLLP
ncbi:TPA: hypothetical protein ON189_004584 [Serratia marcescens]|nr:hypothetical protein [Serratia marcescens]